MTAVPAQESWLDRRAAFAAFALAVVAATNASYLSWWARTPKGAVPLYNDLTNLGDLYPYLGWMKQAAEGHVLFVNLYAPDEQPRVLFLPFFLLLGNVARVTGLPLILALHLGRVAGSLLLVYVARWLCRELLDAPRSRELALLFLVLATGVPFWPEASPVSSMLDNAMFCASWCLLLAGAGHWFRALRAGSDASGIAPAAVAGLCTATLWVVHPYDAVSLHAIVLATGAARMVGAWRDDVAKREIGAVAARLGVAQTIALPGLAMVLGALAANPTLSSWAAVPRLAAGWELTGFGTVAVLAAIRLVLAPRARPELVLWLAAGIVLMFSPMPSARRYIQGLQAPIAILAAEAFALLDARGLRRLQRYLTVAAFPPAAVLLIVDATPIVPVHRHIPRCIVEELAQLEPLPPGIVLAPQLLGLLVPPYSGKHVYLGHAELTPGFTSKLATYDAFRVGKLDGHDLARLGIRYVVLERGVGPTPAGLTPLGSSRCTRLYEVTGLREPAREP